MSYSFTPADADVAQGLRRIALGNQRGNLGLEAGDLRLRVAQGILRRGDLPAQRGDQRRLARRVFLGGGQRRIAPLDLAFASSWAMAMGGVRNIRGVSRLSISR